MICHIVVQTYFPSQMISLGGSVLPFFFGRFFSSSIGVKLLMATILLSQGLTLPLFLQSRFSCLQSTLSFTTLLYYALVVFFINAHYKKSLSFKLIVMQIASLCVCTLYYITQTVLNHLSNNVSNLIKNPGQKHNF